MFVTSAIDALGIPFPGRLILIIAGSFLQRGDLPIAVVCATAGAVLGDHALYLAGRHAGSALLDLYCRLTLGSVRCVQDTERAFQRFGAYAVLLARLSTGVRLFAAIVSGSGRISYARFVAYDAVGSLVYMTACLLLGHLFAEQVTAMLRWLAPGSAVLIVVLAGLVAVVAFRLWRRRRHGAARSGRVRRG